MTFTLLIVDDEPDVVDALRRVLRNPRYDIVGCTHPDEALDVLASRPVDLVISDLDMPGIHGLELLRRVREAHPETIRMVLTGRASLDSALEAINQGEVQRYLTKPWDRTALRRTVAEALDRLAEVRASAAAARRIAAREELLADLEHRYPGLTHVDLEGGVLALDPARLDPLWTLDPAPPDELEGLSGVVLEGRYRLADPIGSGGFGVVYRGVQLSLERPVAVKLLRGGTYARPDHLERFRIEALSSCRVVHPNAVTIVDAGVDDQGLVYLVMELLTGETVADLLKRGQTLPFDTGAAMAADLCAALAVAHDSGILHRDVKPANVFLHQGSEGPVTKLLDFGIAKLATRRDVTVGDHLVGTPAYIAPERVELQEADGRSDVYSVGVLLYEALSAVKPFRGTSLDVLRQQVRALPQPLSTLDEGVPPALDAFVVQLMSKDPADRPTAAEAAATLRAMALPSERMQSAATDATIDPAS